MNYETRREGWEQCWSESAHIPDYFSPGEYEKLSKLRRELFERYLLSVNQVCEFGCGTGHNLTALRGMSWRLREWRLRGFDWAQSAVEHVRGLGIEAEVFDMFNPRDIKISGAVLTVHAMEQLGDDWKQFLAYLLDQQPEICIHIEPIEELYDDSPRDQARLAYHRKRGYLRGYLAELRRLQNEGLAELIEVRKSPFGGKDHDAYSVIVWRPL